ncbi:hypothetical protein HMPREF9318_01335 [Streptococcus urinalis FB127-CNA-2]|uniref:Uncharacterized protein n=1 Tax=Streptococcus urinalis 2285-97 TaxID=764291 RepID=G5KCR4_9STRE|nr:cell wall-active antibiotics response protein LiaF [Streptococcus urinalis]EHJ55859.1 hypothetical protein STRUR_0500 [Streptococcus urinalis 2285-97]EKS19813.1 hypothetical protein HMPREF9318_01335 [Streptococcus urinalis FB127-CNA-2]VEF31389.1 membrane protein [Streptococcus urinalis]
MKKFQFFLLVEIILLALGIMTILSNDVSSFILILVLLLLALRFYNQDSRNNFLLTIGLLLLFLIIMLNPYIVAAVLLGIVYIVLNHFSQVKKKNRFALIKFKESELNVQPIRHQWLGASIYQSDYYAFDDINIIRFSGNDQIDLTKVIVTGKENNIIIRKIYGKTQIDVPIDVEVKLEVSSVYGSVRFFDYDEYDLRNESLKLWSNQYEKSQRNVKIILNVLAGDVEVTRR